MLCAGANARMPTERPRLDNAWMVALEVMEAVEVEPVVAVVDVVEVAYRMPHRHGSIRPAEATFRKSRDARSCTTLVRAKAGRRTLSSRVGAMPRELRNQATRSGGPRKRRGRRPTSSIARRRAVPPDATLLLTAITVRARPPAVLALERPRADPRSPRRCRTVLNLKPALLHVQERTLHHWRCRRARRRRRRFVVAVAVVANATAPLPSPSPSPSLQTIARVSLQSTVCHARVIGQWYTAFVRDRGNNAEMLRPLCAARQSAHDAPNTANLTRRCSGRRPPRRRRHHHRSVDRRSRRYSRCTCSRDAPPGAATR